MNFPAHPLHGQSFVILGHRKMNNGLHYVVELPDGSHGCLPGEWLKDPTDEDHLPPQSSSLLFSMEGIRRALKWVDHLEKRTPPT